MPAVLLVALGGALGAAARYGVSVWSARLLGAGFPYGTLAVNVLGGLAMGLLAGATSARPAFLLLGTGVLGGFTTFSAFSLEGVHMVERGELPLAFAYSFGSVLAAGGAVALGLAIARSLSPP